MYLITGATGNVGSQIVAQLLEQGEPVRVFVRNREKVAHWGDRVEVVEGDYTRPETFPAAFAGVDGVFLMNIGFDVEAIEPLLAAAKAQGRPKIVFLSTILAGVEGFPIGKIHLEKEHAIRASGLPANFLRPSGFMTNSFQWIPSLKAAGEVYNAMGDGRFSAIAAADIAAVAVKALTQLDLGEEVLELTGGESLTVPEQVVILSRVLGKPLRCVDIPVETAIQNMIRSGLPPAIAAGVGKSFEAIRNGWAPPKRDTVEKLLGRAPMTFETWARQNAARFA